MLYLKQLRYLRDKPLFILISVFSCPCLSISLSEKFHYISDDEYLKELLSEGKGSNLDVLFCFVKGLGMTGEQQQITKL